MNELATLIENDSQATATAVVLVAALAAFDIIIIYIAIKTLVKAIRQKYETIIKEQSSRYRYILQLNKEFNLNKGIEREYFYSVKLETKQRFDRFNYTEYFIGVVHRDPLFFIDTVNAARKNAEEYKEYLERVKIAPPLMMKEKVKGRVRLYFEFNKKEKEMIDSLIMPSPVTEVAFTVSASYCSPQGRNRYNGKKTFYAIDVFHAMETIRKRKEDETSIKYQRSHMTNDLRYRILKRDNFRCQICGRSAEDGAKLEVDHIVPVSRGGKTEESNLRTLCKECNSGKRDKYDSTGLN